MPTATRRQPRSRILRLGGVFAALALPFTLCAQVVLNEILYHPVEEPAFNADGTPVIELYDDVHEFVELHNVTDRPVSLGGWKLTGGIEFTFPPTVSIAPRGYLVVAKDPDRLARLPDYQLTRAALHGPYDGQLSNSSDTLRLRDGAGQVVDSVSYSAQFPWPISADALGADQEWTGVDPLTLQYRGRSLERVSPEWSGNDPANWLASPLPGNPTPTRPNTARRSVPKPVVVQLTATPAIPPSGSARNSGPMRVECAFSATNGLNDVKLEYFIDDINSTNEALNSLVMEPVGPPREGRFTATIPSQLFRRIVRYRIVADRGEGSEVVSPRAGDPFGWHAYFVSPARTSPNRSYDLFISTRSWSRLSSNINQSPRRVTLPDPPGRPRQSWNATEPAVFAFAGQVWDVQVRHHGSRYHRDVNRRSLKVKFPRYRRFEDQDSIFITDKDDATVAGHAMFRAAGLPSSRTRWVDLYMNSETKLVRLEEEECNEDLLRRFYRERHAADPSQPIEPPGDLFKAQGHDGGGPDGPYGRIDGRQLDPLPPHWTALQRYEWSYNSQNHPWRGHTHVKELIDRLWAARGDDPDSPNPNESNLRRYVSENWDVDDLLTYLATYTWMGVWDDVFHNYFLWQKRSGKWAMLPWDFDLMFTQGGPTGFATSGIFSGEVGSQDVSFWGPSFFKDTFFKAYREEYVHRLFLLNNTVFHPENFRELGLDKFPDFAQQRFNSINEQCALGEFQRPDRPTNVAPANAVSVLPPAALQASAFRPTKDAPKPHASTTWLIRAANGSYLEPVFRLTSRTNLTLLAVPFETLEFGQTYFWKCLYTDADGHPSPASRETSFTYGDTPAANSPIVLNEIMAANEAAVAHHGHYPDWIELFNRAPHPIDLAGLSLTDDARAPQKFVFPAGSLVPAQGYLVVWCDARTNSPGLHTGFALDAGGQTVVLLGQAADQVRVLDQISFGVQVTDLSIGRPNETDREWTLTLPTPGAPNQPVSLSSPANLKLNEWMASPNSGDDWFELFNPDPAPVPLGGLYLTDDLSHPLNSLIPPLSFLAASGFVKFIADGDTGRGASHVNFKLSANGEALGLFAGRSQPIDQIVFKAQRAGVSEGRLPDGGETFAHFAESSTPGASNYAPLPDVVINEVLSHSDPPLEDAIELHNPTGRFVDLSGWFLSDELGELRKFRIPDGTRLGPGGYVVFYEYHFNPDPRQLTSFALNSARGDEVYLSVAEPDGALTGYRASVKFGAALRNVSFGRYRTSLGVDFVPLAGRTFGADRATSLEQFRTGTGKPNTAPKLGPVVISELMYQPPPIAQGADRLDNTVEEFVELRNLTAAPVPLFDPAHPTNTWRLRDGVEFNFPSKVVLPPHGYALVVSFDPAKELNALAAFCSRYTLPPEVQVFGPYEGRLDNGGEWVGLYRPDTPVAPPDVYAGYVPYVLVERVRYGDAAPWPIGADGTGHSLQRLYLDQYGNDPLNWFAGPPTPGVHYFADTDADGLPDDWERFYRLDAASPTDGQLDPDGDGHTNLDEYRLGTNPLDRGSALRLDVLAAPDPAGTLLSFSFTTAPNKSYTVQWRESLGFGEWNRLQDVPASPAAQFIELSLVVQPDEGARFYRVVAPQQP